MRQCDLDLCDRRRLVLQRLDSSEFGPETRSGAMLVWSADDTRPHEIPSGICILWIAPIQRWILSGPSEENHGDGLFFTFADALEQATIWAAERRWHDFVFGRLP